MSTATSKTSDFNNNVPSHNTATNLNEPYIQLLKLFPEYKDNISFHKLLQHPQIQILINTLFKTDIYNNNTFQNIMNIGLQNILEMLLDKTISMDIISGYTKNSPTSIAALVLQSYIQHCIDTDTTIPDNLLMHAAMHDFIFSKQQTLNLGLDKVTSTEYIYDFIDSVFSPEPDDIQNTNNEFRISKLHLPKKAQKIFEAPPFSYNTKLTTTLINNNWEAFEVVAKAFCETDNDNNLIIENNLPRLDTCETDNDNNLIIENNLLRLDTKKFREILQEYVARKNITQDTSYIMYIITKKNFEELKTQILKVLPEYENNTKFDKLLTSPYVQILINKLFQTSMYKTFPKAMLLGLKNIVEYYLLNNVKDQAMQIIMSASDDNTSSAHCVDLVF